ncbi:MAG: PIN domain-containing protein [Actinobacteria bacterium]|nr:PIN domain-containing protein [Actinomycetota bacterium]
MALLLDSGVVYAYYDADDRWHETVRVLLDGESGPLVVPAVVIPEVDHLLGVRIGHAAQLAMYEDLTAGVYLTVDLEAERYARILELNRRYADLMLGFVDAAVAALSEQLGLERLATTDRRHFPAIAGDVQLDLVPDPPT